MLLLHVTDNVRRSIFFSYTICYFFINCRTKHDNTSNNEADDDHVHDVNNNPSYNNNCHYYYNYSAQYVVVVSYDFVTTTTLNFTILIDDTRCKDRECPTLLVPSCKGQNGLHSY